MGLFMRFIALILILLFAVSAPAFAVEQKNDGKKTEEKKEPAKDADGNIISDDDAPMYVEIAPFVVPVLGANGPEEMVSLVVTLELAPGEDRRDYVKKRLPKLNDAYLQALYGALDRKSLNRGGLIDVSLVKARLIKATERILGKDYVKDVLVQAVAQRKIMDMYPRR